MTDELTQVVQWLGLRLCVPAEWEIVRHSLSLEQGSLVFVDRRHETLRIYWRDCETMPDLNRMVSDQRSKDVVEFAGATVKNLSGYAGWQGTIREEGPEKRSVHAVKYDSPTQRLIQAIITEASEAAACKSQRAALLNDIKVVSKANEARDFCAFGLNVTVPLGFRLLKATAKPADVTFEFAEVDTKHSRPTGKGVTVHRMGMAAAWVPEDKQQLLVKENPQISLRNFQGISRGKHPAIVAHGQETRPRLLSMLGVGRRGDALLWHCEKMNAVYSVATRYLKRTPLEITALSTPCCDEGRND